MTEIVSNPYDFGSPIKSPDKFADRTEEQDRIREYLRLSDTDDPSYYHLALTGSRASGKTSLVNLTEKFSEELDFLPVKMPLNEDLVESDVDFFSEMIDAIMTAGTNKGMYGGRTGEVYQKFREVLDSIDFEARYDLPLGFGSAYVGAQKEDSKDTITQRVLREDLKELHEESSEAGMETIVILLDECDLLAKNTALLQKLRNIFTDIDGYILVMSGTEDMFPDLSDTFSPLPRSFVSIKVDDFEEVEHTEECIKKPLSEEEEEKVDRSTIYDIHRITGGSPYEINLICHHMYRRYVRQDLERIDLSKPVLDDVLEELEGLRREGYHEIADKVGNLSRIQLQLLTSTLEFPNVHPEHFKKYALLDNIDELSRRDSEDIIEDISQRTQELLSLDIIEKKDNKIKFSGSQFDSLYLRYYVASMDSPGTEISFHQGVEGQYVTNIFEKFTQKFFSNTRGSWGYANQPARINITDDENEKSQNREQDRFVKIGTSSGANTSQDLIQRAITTRGDILPVDLVPDEIISFRCNISWLNGGFTAILPSSDGGRLEKIKELKRLLDGTGYNIHIESDYHYFCKGEQEREENNYTDALEYYDKADEINPYNKMTDLRRAEIEHKRGNSDKAIEKLDKICNNQSDWIYPFVSKGLIQIELGNDDGFDLLKSVLPEPVGITGIWETAVEKLDDIGETEKVNYLVGQAIETHSSADNIRVRLAHKLIKIGRPEDAIEFVERIDESDISDSLIGEYYYYSAIAMAKVGDYNNSIENLRLAFDDSDGFIDAVESRDDLEDLRKTDEYDELIDEFEKSEN